jgi:aldehyde:ferredoxin oxidoreductase
MNGFMGRLLLVDLTSGRLSEEALDSGLMHQFVGGAGFAARYLYDRIDVHTDPLGPENPLLFMTGPLVGTAAPLCGRYEVCARSPQTGLWGESNSGGRFGPFLRFSGYDGVLFTGKAARPTYLAIRDGHAELRDAAHLWGKDTYETQEAIQAELQGTKLSIACIGVAGEGLVKYAAVINDWGRAAGRTGMGAVMGSKNLKAIAVGGQGQVPLANPDAFSAAVQATIEAVKEDVKGQFLTAGGTASTVDTTMWMGDIPNKHYSMALWEPVAKLGGGTMAETILTGQKACYRCVIGCGRVTRIGGRHATESIDGPEYETVAAYGSLILSDDLEGTAYASHLCNRFGLDTISAGSTIAFAYQLYNRGILTSKDTGGLKLDWGDIEPALTLTKQIAHREGLGDLLAEGSRALGRRYGVEDQAIQVNGLELPMHDPRAFVGMGLVYATSPRGACHNQGDMFLVDLGAPVPELDIQLGNRLESSEEKALMTSRVMDWRTLYNSLVMCVFCNPSADLVLDLLNGATGWNLSRDELLPLGQRAFQMKRLLNGKLGLTAANDRLPKPVLQPLVDPAVETQPPDMSILLPAYYRIRDWDEFTGMPSAGRMTELGLQDLVAH